MFRFAQHDEKNTVIARRQPNTVIARSISDEESPPKTLSLRHSEATAEESQHRHYTLRKAKIPNKYLKVKGKKPCKFKQSRPK